MGWIAGQVNAVPRESVRLFELAREGKHDAASALYRWFLPLLRLHTVPKFVQLIKLTQERAGWAAANVSCGLHQPSNQGCAAKRAPLCFPAESSYNLQLAATRAPGRGS